MLPVQSSIPPLRMGLQVIDDGLSVYNRMDICKAVHSGTRRCCELEGRLHCHLS